MRIYYITEYSEISETTQDRVRSDLPLTEDMLSSMQRMGQLDMYMDVYRNWTSSHLCRDNIEA
jgi:hypothetical protein